MNCSSFSIASPPKCASFFAESADCVAWSMTQKPDDKHLSLNAGGKSDGFGQMCALMPTMMGAMGACHSRKKAGSDVSPRMALPLRSSASTSLITLFSPFICDQNIANKRTHAVRCHELSPNIDLFWPVTARICSPAFTYGTLRICE